MSVRARRALLSSPSSKIKIVLMCERTTTFLLVITGTACTDLHDRPSCSLPSLSCSNEIVGLPSPSSPSSESSSFCLRYSDRSAFLRSCWPLSAPSGAQHTAASDTKAGESPSWAAADLGAFAGSGDGAVEPWWLAVEGRAVRRLGDGLDGEELVGDGPVVVVVLRKRARRERGCVSKERRRAGGAMH